MKEGDYELRRLVARRAIAGCGSYEHRPARDSYHDAERSLAILSEDEMYVPLNNQFWFTMFCRHGVVATWAEN